MREEVGVVDAHARVCCVWEGCTCVRVCVELLRSQGWGEGCVWKRRDVMGVGNGERRKEERLGKIPTFMLASE